MASGRLAARAGAAPPRRRVRLQPNLDNPNIKNILESMGQVYEASLVELIRSDFGPFTESLMYCITIVAGIEEESGFIDSSPSLELLPWIVFV